MVAERSGRAIREVRDCFGKFRPRLNIQNLCNEVGVVVRARTVDGMVRG